MSQDDVMVRLVGLIEELRPGHYHCDDPFYCCGACRDESHMLEEYEHLSDHVGGENPRVGGVCSCGADQRNAQINDILDSVNIPLTRVVLQYFQPNGKLHSSAELALTVADSKDALQELRKVLSSGEPWPGLGSSGKYDILIHLTSGLTGDVHIRLFRKEELLPDVTAVENTHQA